MEKKQSQLRTLLAAIDATETQELSCDAIGDDDLAGYAEAYIAGEAQVERFAPLRQHIKQCTTCEQRVAELVDLFSLAARGELAQPLSHPVFDFSFLPSIPAPVFLPSEIRALWAQGQQWVRDEMGACWLQLRMGLANALDPQPLLVLKGDETQDDSLLKRLSIGAEELGDMDIEVTARRQRNPADNPESCSIVVQVQIPSRWPEMPEIEVLLIGASQTWSGQTDENGQVNFPAFPIAELEQLRLKVWQKE